MRFKMMGDTGYLVASTFWKLGGLCQTNSSCKRFSNPSVCFPICVRCKTVLQSAITGTSGWLKLHFLWLRTVSWEGLKQECLTSTLFYSHIFFIFFCVCMCVSASATGCHGCLPWLPGACVIVNFKNTYIQTKSSPPDVCLLSCICTSMAI